MDIEEREEDVQAPRKEGYEAVLNEVSSILPNDFFNFDMNGYEYLRSKVIDPIQTRIPILPRIEAYEAIEFIGRYKSGKSIMSYFVIASVVCSTEVGGLQSDVAFFDTDRKLNVDVLALIISQRLSSIQDPKKRSQLYNEALNRVKVYRPKDMTHLALFLCAIRNNHSYSPRLIVLDSLSAYLYDLGNNETLQSTFRSILHHFRCLLREKKCSLILISPKVNAASASFYYMPLKGWFFLLSHRFLLEKAETSWRISNVKDAQQACFYQINSDGLHFVS